MLGNGRSIHIVGVGGSATSGLARILSARGHRVTGSDREEGKALDSLRAAGIAAATGHGLLPLDADLVVHSAAVPASNAELTEARERGLTVCKYAHFLGDLVADRFGIAIAGTHGKTSTAGMLTSIYLAAGRDPDVLIGGLHPDLGANYRVGTDAEFIVEACEFDRSFHSLRPRAGILTNLELDHPDVYATESVLVDAFEQYLAGFAPDSFWVANGDCPGIAQLQGSSHSCRVTFGWSSESMWSVGRWEPGSCPRFEVRYQGRTEAWVTLRVPGRHSASNAIAAYALARELGLSSESIVAGLERFPGMDRRFQYQGCFRGVHVIDDYAHHPTEIDCVVQAARDSFPGARVVVAFQPHQFTRLERFRKPFVSALAAADDVVLTPVFSVRERPEDFDPRLLSDVVADVVSEGTSCRQVVSLDALLESLTNELRPDDVCLLLGAGDVIGVRTRLTDRLEGAVRTGVSA